MSTTYLSHINSAIGSQTQFYSSTPGKDTPMLSTDSIAVTHTWDSRKYSIWEQEGDIPGVNDIAWVPLSTYLYNSYTYITDRLNDLKKDIDDKSTNIKISSRTGSNTTLKNNFTVVTDITVSNNTLAVSKSEVNVSVITELQKNLDTLTTTVASLKSSLEKNISDLTIKVNGLESSISSLATRVTALEKSSQTPVVKQPVAIVLTPSSSSIVGSAAGVQLKASSTNTSTEITLKISSGYSSTDNGGAYFKNSSGNKTQEVTIKSGDNGVFLYVTHGSSSTNVVVTASQSATETFATGSASAKFTVAASAPTNVKVTSVSITPTTLTLSAAKPTGTVSSSVLPTNATDKSVKYSSSDSAVASVVSSTGVVTAKSIGSTIISSVSVVDGIKSSNSCKVTVQGTVNTINVPSGSETITFTKNYSDFAPNALPVGSNSAFVQQVNLTCLAGGATDINVSNITYYSILQDTNVLSVTTTSGSLCLLTVDINRIQQGMIEPSKSASIKDIVNKNTKVADIELKSNASGLYTKGTVTIPVYFNISKNPEAKIYKYYVGTTAQEKFTENDLNKTTTTKPTSITFDRTTDTKPYTIFVYPSEWGTVEGTIYQYKNENGMKTKGETDSSITAPAGYTAVLVPADGGGLYLITWDK